MKKYVVGSGVIVMFWMYMLNYNYGGERLKAGESFRVNEGPVPIYIFGPASSGTRYVSSCVSRIIDSESKWDGYLPACNHVNDKYTIQHVSLPTNGYCNEKEPLILDYTNYCTLGVPKEYYRWFTNITSILEHDRDALAVIVVRDGYFTKRSMKKNHCATLPMSIVEREYDLANQLIGEALEVYPDRIALLSYELLSKFPKHEWKKVERLLGVREGSSDVPPFKNKNTV